MRWREQAHGRIRTTLAARVVRAVTATLLVLMPLFGFIGYRISRGIVREQIVQRQKIATAAAMATVGRLVAVAGHDIQLVAEDGLIERALESPESARALSTNGWQQLQLDEMADLTGPWERLVIADAAGKILLSADGQHVGESIPDDPAVREVFLRACKGETTHSDAYLSRSGARAIVFGAPIRSDGAGKDQSLGVALGWFSLPVLSRFLDQIPSPTVPRIVNAAGVTIVTRSAGAQQRHRLHSMSSESPVVTTVAFQKPVDGSRSDGWQMVFDVPEDAIFAAAHELGLWFLIWGAILTVAIIAVGMLLTRYFVRPVTVLREAAIRVSNGDLESPAAIETGDEFEELALVFNGMVAQLKAQIARTERSEERFRLAARATKDVIFEWDLKTNVCWVNEAWQRRYGYPASGDLDLSMWTEALHPGERESVVASLEAAIAGGEELLNLEYRFRRADGTYADVVTHAYISHDSAGAPVRMAGVMTEITERKRAEAELRKSEERFALATRATDDVIYEWNVGTSHCWVNEAWQSRFGNETWGDVDLSVWSDAIHPDDRDRVLGSLQSAIASGEQRWASEYRCRRGDGTYADVLTRGYIARNPAGEPLRVVGATMDFSEHKRAEEKLRSAEAFLKLTIDNIPEVVAVKSAKDFRYVMANRKAHEWRHSVVGKTDAELFSPEIAARMLSEDEWIVGHKTPLSALPHKFAMEDKVKTFEASRLPLFDSNGEIEFILVVAEDVTEKLADEDLRRQKEAAEAASAAKSAFLARMSHEIRTPMNGVLGMASLLSDTELTSDQREYADTIQSSATALLSVINDVLDFSRIEAGKMVLEQTPFSLRKTISDSAKVLAVAAAQKSIELIVDIEPDVPDALIGDASHLRQMIINLAGNAVKFTDRGEIVIKVALDSSADQTVSLHFLVRDTGKGIPADEIDRLFEAFEQLDSSDTRTHGGTGLGLAITRRLATLMGGRVWAESRPGMGSTFHFTANFGAEEQRTIQGVELRGRQVSVYIENESIRSAVSRIVAAHGAEAGVFDGKTGADDFPEKPGGDVILDLPLDGDAAMIERVLESGVRAEQIVVLIAATRLQVGAQQIARFGISRYLVKPVVEERLIGMIGDAAPGVPPAEPEKFDPVRPLRILVAEDNLVNQRVATRFLERDGHLVTVVSDGYAAVCEFQRHPFDVIFMDVQMPVMDGLTATHEIRKLESSLGPHVPIIALTAHSVSGDREHCLEEGMDGYVSKPFKAAELRSAIAALHLRNCA